MCTSRLRIRGTDMHQQDKEKRYRCASSCYGREEQMCTNRLRRRGIYAHLQAKVVEGPICTSRLRTRGMDVHQQAKGGEGQMRTNRPKEERDRCAPAG
jgi:hypothetical protein